MRLFTDPVDRFFLSKLAVGLLFAYCIVRLVRLFVEVGRGGAPEWKQLVTLGVLTVASAAIFRSIESRRVARPS
jgi:hypothetical protein